MPPIKMIACHYANRSGRGVPATWLPADTVDEMYEAGLVVWNKRHTYVNFKKTEAEIHRVADSIRMGVRVMLGYVEGDPRCVALVEGWTPYPKAA